MRGTLVCIIGTILGMFPSIEIHSKNHEIINTKAMTFFEYVNAGLPDSWIWIYASKPQSPVRIYFSKEIPAGGGGWVTLLPVLIGDQHYILYTWANFSWKKGNKMFHSEYMFYMRYPDGEFHTSIDKSMKDKVVEYTVRYKKNNLIDEAYKQDVEGGDVVEEVKRGEKPIYYFKYECYLLSLIIENRWLVDRPRKNKSEITLEKDVARKLRIMYVKGKSEKTCRFS